MAAGQISHAQAQKRLVTCGECASFRRDTEGRNYHNYTLEFFMGVCELGLCPDTPRKQFANKPRECDKYRK